MALRLVEGFDLYATTGDAVARWLFQSSAFALTAGRFGGNALRISNGNVAFVSRTLPAQPVWVVGAAVRISSVSIFLRDCLHVRDSGTTQVSFRVNTNGSVSATRGGTVLATTAAGVIAPNVWYYLELKATVHDTAGAYDLRVNGQSVLAATGVNTRATANNSANEVLLCDGNGSSGYSIDFDDVYACDGTGVTQNDFLGDCRVQLLRPTAAGDATDFALPAGQTSYAAYRLAVLADSPLHFWELQETSGATSADTGAGTQQAATWTGTRVFAPGPYGGSSTDTGSGYYATVPYQADLNLTGDMTWEAWVYTYGYPTDAYAFARGQNSAWTYVGGVAGGSGLPRWVQGNAGFNFGSVGLPVGRWMHLVFVRTGTSVACYLDGSSLGSQSVFGQTAASSTHPVFFGGSGNGATPPGVFWLGRIAYAALYNTALSAAQVRNHRAFSPFAALDDQGVLAAAGDPTYVQSSTAGATSVYQIQDPVPTTGTVHAVQVVLAAKKDDAGLRVVAPVVKSGATTAPGADLYLGTDSRVGTQLLTTDPDTGAAWTVAALQALQVGARVTG